jgi:hypothetical protein
MEETKVFINKGQYLSDALKKGGYNNIPSNFIIKKTLPGLGATHGEIKAERDSIIIEPNVPVILGKTEGKPELLGVWEGCNESEIKKYLKSKDIKYKKILTTPESYGKVKRVALTVPGKKAFFSKFFCLFDECEKIIQDIDYRSDIAKPVKDFFRFENKAFVSATVLNPSHPDFEKHNFKILKVLPSFDYKKDLDLIITDSVMVKIKEKLLDELKDSECICIFINKTDSIDKIIQALKIEGKSKIFCSKKSSEKLVKRGYRISSDKVELPLAKYNFFTSRFFSAVDIFLNIKPDIVILTDLDEALHTMIDPYTEAIQIYGRFRNKYLNEKIPFNSLTHITNYRPDLDVKTNEEINQMIERYKKTYDWIKGEYKDDLTEAAKRALNTDGEKISYSDYVDENGNFNHFILDNQYNEERIKRYYTDPKLLIQAYNDTGHFNVNVQIDENGLISKFQNKTKGLSASEKRKEIVEELCKLSILKESNPDFDIESMRKYLCSYEVGDKELGQFVVDVFDYLGKDKIESIGYGKKSKLEEALNKQKAVKKEKELFPTILQMIQEEYPLQSSPTKDATKAFLAELYSDHGIRVKVTQTTIEKYCCVTSNNKEKPARYTIQGYKSDSGEKTD